MTSDNKSYLRFSVEESVWFQKGQEVSELVSISLDPDIVIQEHDQYVSIRGALQLAGEYRIDENSNAEDDRDFTTVRVVNQVTTREDGVSELNHSFPVDITIPKNRIQNLDDVYVAIESFDYELPKRGCLQLVADLSISGIYGNQQSVPSVEDSTEEAEPIELFYSPNEREQAEGESGVSEVVEDNVKQEVEMRGNVAGSQESKDEEPEVTFSAIEEKKEESPLSARYLVEEEQESNNVESVNMDLYGLPEQKIEEQEEEDLYTPFEVEARKEVYLENETEVEEVIAAEQVIEVPREPVAEGAGEQEVQAAQEPIDLEPEVEPNKQPALQVGFKGRAEEKYNFGASFSKSVTAVEERNEGEKEETQSQQQGKRSENELYLTKIFARDHEEDFTKMKICIAQHNDTLEAICERYDISLQSLLRVNRLADNFQVNDGQLLYIPISK